MSGIISQILLYFGWVSKYFQSFLHELNTPTLHYSWLVVFFFILIILLVGFSFGKSRMYVGLLSLYVAGFIETRFIYFDIVRNSVEYIKNQPEYYVRLGLFLLFYIISFVILNRSFMKARMTLSEANLIHVLLITILTIGFLTSIVISYIPPVFQKTIPPQLIFYFGTKTAQFLWAIIPLATLLLFKSPHSHPKKESEL